MYCVMRASPPSLLNVYRHYDVSRIAPIHNVYITFSSPLFWTDFDAFPKPELFLLMEHVGAELQAEWKSIGLGLGLKDQDFEIIKANNKSTLEYISKVFVMWHDRETSEYSWQKIAEVLCYKIVSKQSILSDIHAKLSSKYPQAGGLH